MESNFRILKEPLCGISGNFWDLFELDSFNFRSGTESALLEDQVISLIDEFEFVDSICEAGLLSEVIHYLYINFGGTDSTPAKEVLAFSYLLHSSPNLRLPDLLSSITYAIYFNTTLKFLYENNRAVAMKYMNTSLNSLNDDEIYGTIIRRYQLEVLSDMKDAEYIEWLDTTSQDVAEYIKGVNATKNIQKLLE